MTTRVQQTLPCQRETLLAGTYYYRITAGKRSIRTEYCGRYRHILSLPYILAKENIRQKKITSSLVPVLRCSNRRIHPYNRSVTD